MFRLFLNKTNSGFANNKSAFCTFVIWVQNLNKYALLFSAFWIFVNKVVIFSQQITNMHFCSVYFVIGFSTNNKFAFCSCAFCYIFSTNCHICYLFRCKSQQITNLHFVRWNNRFEICYFRSLQITDLDFVRIFLTNLELCNKLSFCRKHFCYLLICYLGRNHNK